MFSSAEVITAATLQLEAAEGINDTPFVTVKVGCVIQGFSVKWRFSTNYWLLCTYFFILRTMYDTCENLVVTRYLVSLRFAASH